MSDAIAPMDGRDVAVVHDGWFPAQLEAQVDLEKKRRVIMVDYFKSCMLDNHHFYRLPGQEDRKPALSKEGALNICSLYKVVPVPDDPVEIWHPDGHYTVRYRTRFLALSTGQMVAVGDGTCTTRESRYAYRQGSRVCPECGKMAIIKGREEYGGGWVCFGKKGGCNAKWADGDAIIESQQVGRIPNEDIADQYNTVLKISEKRSLVDGALKLPLVSEIFTQDLEESMVVAESRASAPSTPTAQPPHVQRRGESRPVPPDAADPKVKPQDVDALLRFMGQVYGSQDRAWPKVLAAVPLDGGPELTRTNVRFRMTRAPHDRLKADAEQYQREDVGDFSGPDPSTFPQDDMPMVGESPSGSDTADVDLEAGNVVQQASAGEPTNAGEIPADAGLQSAQEKLREEAQQWGVADAEITHVMGHHPLAAARNILWKARRPQTTDVAESKVY